MAAQRRRPWITIRRKLWRGNGGVRGLQLDASYGGAKAAYVDYNQAREDLGVPIEADFRRAPAITYLHAQCQGFHSQIFTSLCVEEHAWVVSHTLQQRKGRKKGAIPHTKGGTRRTNGCKKGYKVAGYTTAAHWCRARRRQRWVAREEMQVNDRAGDKVAGSMVSYTQKTMMG